MSLLSSASLLGHVHLVTGVQELGDSVTPGHCICLALNLSAPVTRTPFLGSLLLEGHLVNRFPF